MDPIRQCGETEFYEYADGVESQRDFMYVPPCIDGVSSNQILK